MLPLSGVLVIILGLLFLSVITGGIGENLNFDIDADLEPSIATGGVLDFLIHFVNADKVPTILVLSVLSLFMWMSGVAATVLFNPGYDNMIGFGLLLVVFIVSVIITKFAVMPFIPIFKMLKQGEDNGIQVEGHHGTVKSVTLSDDFGQVEILGPDGPILLNARLRKDSPPLKRGDTIVVLERENNGKFCYVANLKDLNQNIEIK